MSFDSYSAVKTAVADWLNRDDLTSAVPDFITLAHAQINRDLRAWWMESEVYATTTADDSYLTLPTGFIEMRSFKVQSGSYWYPLEYLSPTSMNQAGIYTSGQPKYFAVQGGRIQLLPTPDDAYRVQMIYYKKITALSDTNTTNNLLTYAPDMLLYASLLQATAYVQNDVRLKVWGDAYKAIVDQINISSMDTRFSGSALSMANDARIVV